MTPQRDDYDSPWKEALARYFEAFLTFFFPDMAAEVDWSQGYELLENEFRQVVREAVVGRRTVDALVRVFLLGGRRAGSSSTWRSRIRRTRASPSGCSCTTTGCSIASRRPVVSLAILGDADPDWRPDRYEVSRYRCRVALEYPTVKLLDYDLRLPELQSSSNPFAVLVAAISMPRAPPADPGGACSRSSAWCAVSTSEVSRGRTSWSSFGWWTGSWPCPQII